MLVTTLLRSLSRSPSSSTRLVGSLVIVASILASPTLVSAQPIELLNTGVGGGGTSADNAWGSFDSMELWTACTRMDTENLPAGPQSFTVTSGTADFTSPAGTVGIGGEIRWCINRCEANESVGEVLSQGGFVVTGEPPAYPGTQTYDLDPTGASLVTHDGSDCLYFCLKTTNPDFHIAAFAADWEVWVAPRDIPPTPFGGLDLGADVQVTLGAPPPPTPTCETTFAPQAGAGPGSGGAMFNTSVTETNGGLEDVTAHLGISPRGAVAFTEVISPTHPVGQTDSFLLGDPIRDAFGTSAFGATRVIACTDPSKADGGDIDVMTQAVIFATLPDGSQYGQYFQFRTADEALQAGETGWLFTTHDPNRYRVNLGVTAVADGTRVVLTPRGDGGMALGSPTVVEFDEGGNTQFNDIYTSWGLGNATDVMVEAMVESGAAFVFSSILDGRGQVQGTSDPTSILPVTEGSSRAVLLEVGRITGLNEFSGSASIFNHGSSAVNVQVDFHERGVPGVSASDSFSLGAMEAMSWDDAVGDLVNRTGVVGSLVFTVQGGKVDGDGISVIGREFAIFRGGGGDITGTAGQAMPGLPDADQLMQGETFHFIGLRDRQLSDGPERSHLGLLNLGSGDVTVTVNGFADDGSSEGSIQSTVRGGEQLRINNVLREINPSQDGGIKRIEVTVTGGAVHALAYLVNSTGDPVTLLPFRR